ncbi:MAG: hypothetical protein ACYS67_18925, partial [Planctomycetota bacterium]
MRRKIASASLLFAFFTPAIVIFGGPKREFVHFIPDEIIVKFKPGAAAALEEKTSAGAAAEQLGLP